MDCLNGRRRATGGKVLANGEDFYRHFDSFRQSLGYVPQKDIVHTQLTVARRPVLHRPAAAADRHRARRSCRPRIEEVLQQMELDPHRDTLVAQPQRRADQARQPRRRAARPAGLLYIDEATSGLDAGTEARMMRLFRRLADEGKSLVCITHNVDNVDRCHLILVLARGKLIYYGPPAEAPAYFGVPTAQRRSTTAIQEREVDVWEKEYAGSSLYHEYVAKRASRAEARRRATPSPPRVCRPPNAAESVRVGLSNFVAWPSQT